MGSPDRRHTSPPARKLSTSEAFGTAGAGGVPAGAGSGGISPEGTRIRTRVPFRRSRTIAFATCAGFAAGVGVGCTAALLGVRSTASLWGPRLCMLGVGPLVDARVRLPAAACAILGALAGLAQGHAATSGELEQITRGFLWTFGLAVGAGLLGAYANTATRRLRAFWVQVGVRMAGSDLAGCRPVGDPLAKGSRPKRAGSLL